ncbi:TPA: DUF2169 domain-containing protein [Proteus mirabilis]|nr:DUF2169 domain-containing protein [Proteus mirabilis]
MELINNAKHTVAKATVMIDKAGFEYLVVVIKATYHISENNQLPRPIIPSQPLVYSDIYYGEVGKSAPIYDADFVLKKQKCDVIFNAKAFAPHKKPISQLIISVQVGDMIKKIAVFGQRNWCNEGGLYKPGVAEPFTEVSLHYGVAFGGKYYYKDEQISHSINPLGIGYFLSRKPNNKEIKMPQLECIDEQINTPESQINPIALSVLPRHYGERVKYAGTFDEKWRNETAPFLPRDFDERYFQSAPADQQIDFPIGNEVIVLNNIHPLRSKINFKLPRLNNIPVRFYQRQGEVVLFTPSVDTLYFEPEKDFFSVTWRCQLPIQNILDIEQILIGPRLDSYVSRQTYQSICKG